MAHYLTENDQQYIYERIMEYLKETKNGSISTKRSNIIITELFKKYFDKLIMGVIFNSMYNFWRFAELNDLLQEGRLAILLSIHNNQFDKKRGTIFNFFSTVVARNLINYTKKMNKKIYENTTLEITNIYNDDNLYYFQKYEDSFIVDEAFGFLKEYFKGKKKFEQLTDLLYKYYILHQSKKFVKKDFIAYAKAHNYSPANVNNYFSYLKRLKTKKPIKVLLEIAYGK